jgi:hypothetical protein
MRDSTEHFTEHIKRMVARVGEDFQDPADDWLSMLFFEGGDEGNEFVITALPGELFDGSMRKDQLVVVLDELMRQHNARRFALLLNSWAIRAEPIEGETPEQAQERVMRTHEEYSGRFHEHPSAVEMLTLFIADQYRDHMWMADIQRHTDRPPTLAEWKLADNSGEGRFAGLGEALRGRDE